MEKPDPAVALVDRLVRLIALLGGVVLLGLMLLTVVDVGLRYVFNAPIFGAQDVAKLGLLIVVACSFAYGGRVGAHVAVDLLGFVAPQGLLRWTDLLVRCGAAVMLTIVAWQSYLNGLGAAEYGEASTLLAIPFLPFYFIIAIGLLLYVVVLVVEAWVGLRGAGVRPLRG